jgi:hypothetical protein
MYVIQAWSKGDEPKLHDSFFVSITLAMEACYTSLRDSVAALTSSPERIKWTYDGFLGAYVGTTEYGIDYEIYRLVPSG